MIVLGIESTCDETAASLVEDGRRLLSNVISTSVKEQALYGGVVPEIATTANSSAPQSKRLCWTQARPWTMWTRWPSPLRRA
jgi:tRNA A37 threonylcarbamoyltransferase TsaD